MCTYACIHVCVWEGVRAQKRDREKERVSESESTTFFSSSSDFVLYCSCRSVF